MTPSPTVTWRQMWLPALARALGIGALSGLLRRFILDPLFGRNLSQDIAPFSTFFLLAYFVFVPFSALRQEGFVPPLRTRLATAAVMAAIAGTVMLGANHLFP